MKCKDANHVCDKSQYKEANLWEKIKLSIHLIYCSYCRKYSANNNKLTEVIKDSNIQTISETEKETMDKKLHQEMAK